MCGFAGGSFFFFAAALVGPLFNANDDRRSIFEYVNLL